MLLDVRRAGTALARAATLTLVLSACGGGHDTSQPPAPKANRGAQPMVLPGPVQNCLRRLQGHWSLSASPTQIDPGGSSTVSWSFSMPGGCDQVLGQLRLAGRAVAASGTMVVQPMSTTTYSLGFVYANLSGVTVSVRLPATVEIKGSTPEWARLLIQAVGTPNTTVRLDPGVDMDLSFVDGIEVADGVTLTSDHPLGTIGHSQATQIGGGGPGRVLFSARTPSSPGPRLYTSARPRGLFSLSCAHPSGDLAPNNVTFSGFRLEGPHQDTMDGDDNLEVGINLDSCLGVRISNMEISGWSGAAVYVQDSANREVGPTGSVSITDSYIHNNQHVGGNGYGVAVSAGAWADVERNLFDLNRHAVEANGNPGTGYRAEQNLVLAGGGVHGRWYEDQTHLFDVHGDANCPNIPGNQNSWNCGNAGDQFWYVGNAFQYTKSHDIKIRGTVRVQAVIDGNVFPFDQLDGDAVSLHDHTNIVFGTGADANITGVNTFGQYGVCDFNGDGRDDLFLPTGASWWFSSGGEMPWWYLRPATERIDQVLLGYFDGDSRCDVLAVHGNDLVLSSGGTGPWQVIGSYGIPLDQLRVGHFTVPAARGDLHAASELFRRAPDGTWSALPAGSRTWVTLGSSSFPLAGLRFGDVDGDGKTDVIAVEEGHWSYSSGGTTGWQPLNTRMTSLDGVFVADVDGDGTDDLIHLGTDATGADDFIGTWQVSWGGRSDWKSLAAFPFQGLAFLHAFAGHFDGSPGLGLLVTDENRAGRLYTQATGQLRTYSLFQY